jgi:hypothetical protein
VSIYFDDSGNPLLLRRQRAMIRRQPVIIISSGSTAASRQQNRRRFAVGSEPVTQSIQTVNDKMGRELPPDMVAGVLARRHGSDRI